MSRMSTWIRSRSRWALAAGAVGTAGLALSSTAALGGFTASITNTGSTASSGTLVMSEQVGGAGGTVCLSSSTGTGTSAPANTTNSNASCGANKFNVNNAVPGATPVSTSVQISNTGNIPASALTMAAGACTSTAVSGSAFSGNDTTANNASSNFCGKVDITIDDITAGTSSTTARCVYGSVGTGTGQTSCAAPSSTYTLASYATAYSSATSILPASTTVAAGGNRTYRVTVQVDSGTTTNADQGLSAAQNITFAFAQ